mmetsp:Transcript_39960/g.56309  ORF Transcript_39960/g.56309 Transcript_39960/m.56309 type:complete len:432 (+) Transcript_39960:3-1298(+)
MKRKGDEESGRDFGTESEEVHSSQEITGIPPPVSVPAVPRTRGDVEAMNRFFSPAKPPVVTVRSSTVLTITYGFGDASGLGKGSTIEDFRNGCTPMPSVEGIRYRIGVWEADEAGESSNYREFTNVVEALEEDGDAGRLQYCEVFFFTDNATVETALFKGTSSSQTLLDLVIRFHLLRAKYQVKIHVIHCAGTRMIAQGTDGVSRGCLLDGVMAGKPFLSFVPLHKSALERSPDLEDWISSWAGGDPEFLQPIDWFRRGHDMDGGKLDEEGYWHPIIRSGTFVWSPPPAAADVALEELRKARIKRTKSIHIFVCPRLMTPHWQRQMWRAADLVFTVPVVAPFWPVSMHEPVLIGICLPFCRHYPWQLRGTPKMYHAQGKLRNLFKTNPLAAGPFLCKLLQDGRRYPSMSGKLVIKLLCIKEGGQIPHSLGS